MHLSLSIFITYQQFLNSSATLYLDTRSLIIQGKLFWIFFDRNCKMLSFAAWSDCISVFTVRRLFCLSSNKKKPRGKKFENYCRQNNEKNLHYLSLDKLRTDLRPHFVLISHKRFWNINKTTTTSCNHLISCYLKRTFYTFIT